VIKLLYRWLLVAATIMVFWIALSIIINQSIIFPGPDKVVISLLSNIKNHVHNASVTSFEAFIGLGLSVLFSLILIAFVAFSKNFEKYVYTFGIFLKAAPAVAYAPILIIFVGNNLLAKSLVSSMISFFPILNGGIDGIRNTPDRLKLLSKVYSGNSFDTFCHINIGYSISGFLSGLKTAAPLSVVGAIVGEFVSGGNPTGLGTFIFSSYANLQMSDVFAGVFISTLIGLLFFALTSKIAESTNDIFHLIK
jgi:NitT/TauT family transport system permease protein